MRGVKLRKVVRGVVKEGVRGVKIEMGERGEN